MLNIDEEQAKKSVDDFLSDGILNYILVYLVVQYLLMPTVEWITGVIQKFIGKRFANLIKQK